VGTTVNPPPGGPRPRAATASPYEPAWTVDRAFQLFESRTNLERGGTPHLRQYRLERMEKILAELDNPHLTLRVVHVAGSKGKGSTSAYTAALLAEAGFLVGLYTSPHIVDYRERFTLLSSRGPRKGATLETAAPDVEMLLAKESRRVWAVVEKMARNGVAEEELPTTFELLTALAFRLFRAAGCDYTVLETGLGGRLDATNLCRPVLTMITRIELEHREYLGDTLAAIAGEKAGILKPGVPVVIAPQQREARRVLDARARRCGALRIPMRPLGPIDGTGLAMRGSVQRINAGQALAGYDSLRRRSMVPPLTREALLSALRGTRLPGRGELLDDLFFDGAHTPESVAQAVRSLGGRDCIAILGVVDGKDLAGIATALRPRVARVIVSTPGTFKPGNPAAVLAAVEAAGIPAELVPDPSEALLRAREYNRGRPILVTGSFYMVGAIRRLIPEDTIPCR
jgi:dihydrofolate synthase / folylpolyglutamate synthase